MQQDSRAEYTSLYRIAFAATILMLVIIPVQIAVFIVTKMPTGVAEWFTLFRQNPLAGFFHADFFILVNNILIAVIYLALYHTLKDTDRGIAQIAVALGLLGIAAYISSNKTFELYSLSAEYFASPDAASRTALEAAGKSLLAGWQGTAFDAYYVLNGITLLLISSLMYRCPAYGKATATWGLSSGILMMIPSTAGFIGLVCSLLSLVPWYVFSVRFAIVFRRMKSTTPEQAPGYVGYAK